MSGVDKLEFLIFNKPSLPPAISSGCSETVLNNAVSKTSEKYTFKPLEKVFLGTKSQ